MPSPARSSSVTRAKFFDALSELDDPAMQRWDDSSHQVESKKSGDEDAKTVKYRHHDAGASWLTQSLPGDHSSVLWRRRSRVAPGDETKADSLGLSPERPGSLSGSSITASEQSGNGDKIANHSEPACLSGVLWWCLKPVLRILLRRGVEQVTSLSFYLSSLIGGALRFDPLADMRCDFVVSRAM